MIPHNLNEPIEPDKWEKDMGWLCKRLIFLYERDFDLIRAFDPDKVLDALMDKEREELEKMRPVYNMVVPAYRDVNLKRSREFNAMLDRMIGAGEDVLFQIMLEMKNIARLQSMN